MRECHLVTLKPCRGLMLAIGPISHRRLAGNIPGSHSRVCSTLPMHDLAAGRLGRQLGVDTSAKQERKFRLGFSGQPL